MFRSARTAIKYYTPSFVFPIFSNVNENDSDVLNSKSLKPPESGWDRVKQMYSRNELDEISVELHTVAQSAFSGAFFGACIGGFVHSRNAYINFIETNEATIFKTPMEAKKKLQDFVTVAFAKGAYQWGWRLSFFTGTFSLIATTISVYNGDTSLIQYISAGAITGGLYKAHLGLAATFVGAGLGAVLSTVAGLAILGILKATGFSMTEIRKALYSLREAREDQYKQAVAKASEDYNDPLTRHHEAVIKEKGEKKLEEI